MGLFVRKIEFQTRVFIVMRTTTYLPTQSPVVSTTYISISPGIVALDTTTHSQMERHLKLIKIGRQIFHIRPHVRLSAHHENLNAKTNKKKTGLKNDSTSSFEWVNGPCV